MATIRDIHNAWRDALLPAMFDGVPFFCEAGSRETGRRVVIHEYPKRELPYSEDMGRRAIQFTVRGYIVSFMKDMGLRSGSGPIQLPVTSMPKGGIAASLYMKDYRIGRDLLQTRLDNPSEGVLQLPNMARAGTGAVLTLTAICSGYRMVEEDRFGGYAVFDMTFVEYGLINRMPPPSAVTALKQEADNTYSLITQNLENASNVQA